MEAIAENKTKESAEGEIGGCVLCATADVLKPLLSLNNGCQRLRFDGQAPITGLGVRGQMRLARLC